MGRFLLGLVIGIILVPLAALAYFKYGNVPVAVNDPPFPDEKLVTSVPLNARIDRDMVKTPPIEPSEDNFVAGAHIYADQCAACHGFHGKRSVAGTHEFPAAPPLWEKHHNGSVVGVSDDPPGETYWKVANGIRLSGMPAFKDVLNETQMWQVSLLLANADKALPPAAVDVLKGETVQTPTGPAAAPHAQQKTAPEPDK
ncbi:MAG TPA: cytochrome c [Terracidiphilus sp.]|nr:cytochrome c [Terracidiphilus sp.]